MQTEPKRSFKGVWIPREVWLSKELTWREKCLLAEIDSLGGSDEGGCIAGNGYLANMFDTTPGTIAVDLTKLRKMGFLEQNNQAKDRVLRVSKLVWEKPLQLLAPAKGQEGDHLAPAKGLIKPLLNDGGGTILKEVLQETNSASALSSDRGTKSPQKQLTDGWCEEWAKHHPGCGPYNFQVKDGVAAARLLKTGLTPDQLLAVAREAWKRPEDFNCKQAATLAGFASRFNDIRVELAPKPVPVIKPPTPTPRIVNGNY